MDDDLHTLLELRNLERILAVAEADRRVLSRLLPFTYQPDGLLRWRAVEALGVAASCVAARDPEFVRGIIRRLFWSLSDESGSIGWSAPEAIGEIVANRPALFADYTPMVVSLFDNLAEEYFRPGILWAIGRIAASAPTLMRDAYDPVVPLLGDPNPQVRGLAAWCLGRLGTSEAVERLRALVNDHRPVQIYEGGFLRSATVGELARSALRNLPATE